jgi:hypothetical protein
MVAMSGRSQSGVGSNYPLVKGRAFRAEQLMYVWKDQTSPCFVATFSCFVTIFLLLQNVMLCNKKKKKAKTIQTLKGTKMMPDNFSCKK